MLNLELAGVKYQEYSSHLVSGETNGVGITFIPIQQTRDYTKLEKKLKDNDINFFKKDKVNGVGNILFEKRKDPFSEDRHITFILFCSEEKLHEKIQILEHEFST